MPKQRIRELDLTGILSSSSIVNTVYFPLKLTSNSGITEPILFKDADTFKTWAELSTVGIDMTKTGYKVAYYLLTKGMSILAQGVVADSNTQGIPASIWTKLEDKANYDIRFITTGDFIQVVNEKSSKYDSNAVKCAAKRGDCIYLIDYCDEAETTQYLHITEEPVGWESLYTNYYHKEVSWTKIEDLPGGRPAATDYVANKYYVALGEINSSAQAQLLTISEAPSDWDTATSKYYTKDISYVQFTTQETPPAFASYEVYESLGETNLYDTASVRTYFENAESGYEAAQSGRKVNDFKYTAAFVPDFKSSLFKNEDGTLCTLNASYGYLFSFIESTKAKNNAEWLACAGSFRGLIPELKEVLRQYSNAECEILQARKSTSEVELDDPGDNVGIAINPIAYVRPFGNIIWGNRTLLKAEADDNNNGILKASNFLNIRELVCTISKELYNASRKYTFEQNTNALWANFQNELAPTLDKMKSGNGILDYRWRKGTTTKKARLVATLRIIPIEALEDFDLTIVLSDTLDVTE